MPAQSKQARIFFLSLDHFDDKPSSDRMCRPLLDTLVTKATLERASKPEAALKYLSTNLPTAIIITDSAITEPEHAALLEKIISYVRDGGTAILAGYFTCFVNWFDPHGFFRRWDLPWEFASYTRETVYVNLHVQQIDKVGLPAAYNNKALFLKNVSRNAALYHPLEDHNRTETSVAFAAVGKGRLGYVGDVNGEEGTNAIIVAMCGL
jgi:hypothetical protein